jgi:hypothetical protein
MCAAAAPARMALVAAALLATAAASAAPLATAAEPQPLRTTLPIVAVETAGPIGDEPKVTARLRVIDGRGAEKGPDDPADGYDGWAGIEWRGHSSLRFRKKSYGIELRDASGRRRRARLLGRPADDDWVLYASYNDKTLLRNVLAHSAARRLGRWSAGTRFVELVVNGQYRGVYVLMERVELGAGRVRAPQSAVLGELTAPWMADPRDRPFRTRLIGRVIAIADPDPDRLLPSERRDLRRSVDAMERALYTGPPGGWRRHLEPSAAVDYVLLQELFKNLDAFRASTFFTRASGGRIRLGPIWDLDRSMGNSTTRERSPRGWVTRGRPWGSRLRRDPAFRAALSRRWQSLQARGFGRRLLRELDATAADLRRRGAVRRNFTRWPVLDERLWSNPRAHGSYRGEVRAVRRWLNRRLAWLDRAVR